MLQPPQIFTVRGFEALFPLMEAWVSPSVLLPSWSSLFICPQMWDPWSSGHCLAVSLLGPAACLYPSYLSR